MLVGALLPVSPELRRGQCPGKGQATPGMLQQPAGLCSARSTLKGGKEVGFTTAAPQEPFHWSLHKCEGGGPQGSCAGNEGLG